MKKVLVVLFVITYTLTFTSCNKDDDDKTDPIVGKWQLSQEFENGMETQLDDCAIQNTLEFKTDGTLSSTSYFKEDSGTCTVDSETGIWVNLANSSVYKITASDIEFEITKTTDDEFYSEFNLGEDTYKYIFKRVN